MLGLTAAEIFGFDLDALRPLAEKIGPTPTDLGQLGEGRTAADLTARWAPVKEVGRHWLTGHDFPLIARPVTDLRRLRAASGGRAATTPTSHRDDREGHQVQQLKGRVAVITGGAGGIAGPWASASWPRA